MSITIEQLRLFIAIAEEGSFSAAGRKLDKVQSAVSYSISKLEQELGVKLFDRSTRSPSLTRAGESLLIEARNSLRQVDRLHHQARAISSGLEASLSIAIDALFPVPGLVQVCSIFDTQYPMVSLEIHSESLGASIEKVITGVCGIAIAGPESKDIPDIVRHPIGSILMYPYTSPMHPLAITQGEIPDQVLAQHTQIVLTDRSTRTQGRDVGVLSSKNWRVTDLATKYALIRGGLGWGNLPLHMANQDELAGHLIRITPRSWRNQTWDIPLYAIHRNDSALGPAGRHFIEFSKQVLEGLS